MTLPMFAHLLGCPAQEEAPPPPEAEPCTLTYESLPGRTFMRQLSAPDGKTWLEDPWARARFYEEDGKVKLKYNTRSVSSMYTYTCEKKPGELFCQTDNPDLQQWCQTLIANTGSCSPADLADRTGVPIEEATKAQQALAAAMKGMTAEQKENMKVAYSAPANQLRGAFHAKINKEDCRITGRDTYMTMTYGEIRELENYVGTSRFVESDADLVFEDCKDNANLVALTAPGAKARPNETKLKWKVNDAIPFKYVGDAMSKPEGAACTYTMDTYINHALMQKDVAVTPGADGKLDWSFSHTFTEVPPERGRGIVHVYRKKACDGAEAQLVDVSCAMVLVEDGAAAGEG
jgi:hypothetical protein